MTLAEIRQKVEEERIYCKYDGMKLKKDHIGKYCPNKKCQWRWGIK